jgi:general secretion pathway protein D
MRRSLALAALLLVPATARAQGPTTPTTTPALDESQVPSPRRAGDLVSVAIENAELPDLVRTMSEMTGRRFVLAATPKSFQATIVAPQKVTVAEAYQAFLTVLAANHLTVVPRGRFFKIIDAQDAVHDAPIVTARDGAGAGAGTMAEERYVTYLRRVAHVSAEEVASGVLSKLASHDGAVLAYGDLLLVTDTGLNVQRITRVLDEIDVARPQDRVWLEPLQYVAASELKKELDELLGSGAKDPKATKDAAPSTTDDARVTRLVAVERPNALLVVGGRGGYQRVLELIRSLDVAVPSDGQMHVVMLQHADAKKLVGPINEAVSAASGAPGAAAAPVAGATSKVLESSVKVSAEETNNALLVTASAHDFAAVREVIRALDQPRRQVYIEAVVMDLSVQRTNELDTAFHGFDALGSSTLYGGNNPLKSLLLPTDSTSLQALVLGVRGPSVPVPPFLQGLLGTTSIPGLGFFLDAYATASDTDILSTPHILATDNTPAELHVQLNTSLQRNAASFGSPTTGAASGAASALSVYAAPATQNYGKIGPQIKVTPHIDESDDVRLDVQETISDITTDGPQGGTLGTINFNERGATTTLTVKDGHTAVIGGLVKDKVLHQTTKVPLLGDIPVLGALFRSSSDQVEKDNLVLVLTPHIIRNEEDMRRIFEQRMQERQEFLDHFFVFRDGPPIGFDPARGHGLLAELQNAYAEVAERRRFETDPQPLAQAHGPKEPIDLPLTPPPEGVAAPQPPAAPGPAAPALTVAAPSRSVERIEK